MPRITNNSLATVGALAQKVQENANRVIGTVANVVNGNVPSENPNLTERVTRGALSAVETAGKKLSEIEGAAAAVANGSTLPSDASRTQKATHLATEKLVQAAGLLAERFPNVAKHVGFANAETDAVFRQMEERARQGSGPRATSDSSVSWND